ncbi:GARP complex component [Aspergillus luchuensis]|uniref:GARP complex component n=1 Tax=Aspergillus kawachii TaxID=1069201 RepID=A0A146EYB0_ASPKA|nr:GARP complex component [Aspergillus luchuensis]
MELDLRRSKLQGTIDGTENKAAEARSGGYREPFARDIPARMTINIYSYDSCKFSYDARSKGE